MIYRPDRSDGQDVSRKQRGPGRLFSRLLYFGVPLLLIPAAGAIIYYGGTKGSHWLIEGIQSSVYFRLDMVRVTGNTNIDHGEIVEAAGISVGQSLFAANLDDIQERLRKHPLVRSAGVRRRLPREIHIDIEERVPAVLLRGEKSCVVDAEGFVMGFLENEVPIDLPSLEGVEMRDGIITAAGLKDLSAGLALIEAIREERDSPT